MSDQEELCLDFWLPSYQRLCQLLLVNATEIQQAALMLSPQEKASFADLLIDSITQTTSAQNLDKWVDVAHERASALKENPALGRPLSEFMDELQNLIS